MIPLKCGIPVDFEFTLSYVQLHPAFTVEPMSGRISKENSNLLFLFSINENKPTDLINQCKKITFHTHPIRKKKTCPEREFNPCLLGYLSGMMTTTTPSRQPC